MVLFYSGGDQRPIWTQERAQPYITYVDEQNTSHWFFDSFLMLEILNTSDNWQTVREYTKGMRYESATKAEWMKLIDCYFNSETGIAAIEAGVKKAMTTMGAPAYKRQVIIGIPEPIDVQNELVSGSSSVYWGEIDNMSLDFSKPADRVKACKWFIDQVRARFSEKGYQYVDLAGFYWIAEDASHTGNIITPIANYLNELKYSFNWIPFSIPMVTSLGKNWDFTMLTTSPTTILMIKYLLHVLMKPAKKLCVAICRWRWSSRTMCWLLTAKLTVWKTIWQNSRSMVYGKNAAWLTIRVITHCLP